MAIELSLAVRAELQARADEADRLRMQQVQRAQQEAAFAARQYRQVDPDNRLVATTLESEWNDKLRALAQAQDEAERQRAADQATLDEATEARIRALAADFPTVWNDPTTSHRDKKRMAALLIEDVTLLKAEKLHVHIRFKGGACESLVLPLPKNAWRKRLTPPEVVTRVDELLEQHDFAQVVTRLNAEGLRTGAGGPFDEDALRWVCYTHGLNTPIQRLRDAGKLTVREAAGRLGLPESTVRDWARDGRLRGARHGRKPTWLLEPLDEQPEQIQELAKKHAQTQADPATRADSTLPELPARVSALLDAGHDDADIAASLNTEGWPRANGSFDARSVGKIRRRWGLASAKERLRASGKLTTQEIAVRLGIGVSTIYSWVRAGRLRGRHVGRPATWIFDAIEDQPEPIRQRVASRATVGQRRPGLLSDAAAGPGAL